METNAPIGTPVIPRYFHQLGILVLDGSGSMTDKAPMNSTKAKEVNSGVVELFNRLNVSRVKQNFSFACIKFDETATVTLPPTPFDFNRLMGEDYDPTVGKGGGTQIFEALNEAKKLAENFLNSNPIDGVPHKALILLMSDGMCFQPQTTISVAASLKSNPKINIACAYFGTVGETTTDAQKVLKEVSTDPATFYTTVYDGEALRAFFERSISQSAGIKID
ncbi:vWA domain-containing protein [Pedobacter suwonensis]|uniref:vWA domain-containing protein n=1 Tax=Pedobacter suwonensis TaxID=332999 RepID=UPI00119DBC03|nr:vWA domain-containing protein [Pedobacter suwonensis]